MYPKILGYELKLRGFFDYNVMILFYQEVKTFRK